MFRGLVTEKTLKSISRNSITPVLLLTIVIVFLGDRIPVWVLFGLACVLIPLAALYVVLEAIDVRRRIKRAKKT